MQFTTKTVKATFLIICFALTGIFLFSGCWDGADEQAAVNCKDSFCIGLLLRTDDVRYSLIEAANLAKDDINKAGGNAKLILGDVSRPLASAEELLNMGIKAIIGPPSSAQSVGIFDFLTRNGLVAISPSATSVTLTERNRELAREGKTSFFFRTVPSDLFQAQILADQAQGEVLIVHREDNYGEKLAELINENLLRQERTPAKVVSYALYDAEAPDSARKTQAVIRDIEAVEGIGNIDSIIVATSVGEGGRIIGGMLNSPVIPAAQYYISDSLAVENLHELVDPENPAAVEGFKSTSPCALPDPPERKDEFEKRFDPEEFPSLQFTVHAYDAVVVAALAALSAGSENPSEYVSEMAEVTGGGNQCLTYAECAAALTDETTANDDINYEGISGPIEFDENGDIGAGCYSVYTYDAMGGRTRQIFDVPGLNDITPGPVP